MWVGQTFPLQLRVSSQQAVVSLKADDGLNIEKLLSEYKSNLQLVNLIIKFKVIKFLITYYFVK